MDFLTMQDVCEYASYCLENDEDWANSILRFINTFSPPVEWKSYYADHEVEKES